MITIASNLHQKILSTTEDKRQTMGPRLAVQISEPYQIKSQFFENTPHHKHFS